MDIEKDASPQQPQAPVAQPIQIHTLLLQIKDTLVLLDKAITNKQTRTITRIAKNARKYRNVILPHHLVALFEALGINSQPALTQSGNFKADFVEKVEINKNLVGRLGKTLELEAFVRILQIEVLWNQGLYRECLGEVEELLTRITQSNRRNLDNYSAFLYHFYSRLHQKNGSQQSIRENLLQGLNRAYVRQDQVGQETLLNLLVRNYLRFNHIQAAYNLIQKSNFPKGKFSNEHCKHMYYIGRVKAIRRDYPQALNKLNQAIRKSPDKARGFKIQCQKVAIVVELLMGQIPNREIFVDQLIFQNVFPYYRLIQVVLEGNLEDFTRTVEQYKATYQKDNLYTMILRLNQIVIRIGLRRISVAYSNISLADISRKVQIPLQDVEFVVAKALRDGVMHGVIDHEAQILKIDADQNIYVTNQPQVQLNKRIEECLELYHDVQRAITYPDMKVNVEQFKQQELDASQLLNLLDFDDDM